MGERTVLGTVSVVSSLPVKKQATSTGALLRDVIRALNRVGVDVEMLLKRTGLTARGLNEVDARVPIDMHNVVWAEAIRLSNDDLLGLRVAVVLQEEQFELIGGIVQHSATLADAIIRLGRYGRLLGSGFDTSLEVRAEDAVLRIPHVEGPPLHFQGALCQLSTYGLIGRRLTGQPIRATAIRMMHPRPPFAERLESAFGAPFQFDALENAMLFPSQYLHMAIPTSDPARCAALEEEARDHLRRLSGESSLAASIEALLTLEFSNYGLQELARKLGVGPRTLTRRLATEGTSYQQIKNRVQRRMAERYLRSTALPVTEIALFLGFSDAPAFIRAFRRWTGTSPTAFRLEADPIGPG